MLPRMTVNEILELDDNKKGYRNSTLESVFFYEGGDVKEGDNTRINAKLVDYNGDQIDAVIWGNNKNLSGDIFDYEDKFVARVKGYKTTYNEMPQVTINEIEQISPANEEYNELVKVYTEYKQRLNDDEKNAYVERLKNIVDSVENPYYKRLLLDIFDERVIEKFKEWTAAWEMHHAFPGGLLVHTVNVAEKCKAVAELPGSVIDRDPLLTAALLHDVAKIKEYDGFPSKRRLYRGRMLYHAYMGAEMVAIQIDKYRTSGSEEYIKYSDFPENLEIQLKHCILSHHGLPEYGAAVKPMILEANILHMMDDADAKEEYYLERVIESKEFDAEKPADAVKGYYDSFTKEFAYPTWSMIQYAEPSHTFEVESDPEVELPWD